MRRLLAALLLSLPACQPFGDTATPAAEAVAGMTKVFNSHSSAFEKLIANSNASTEVKAAIATNIAQDREAYRALAAATMQYLEKLGRIEWSAESLKEWAKLVTRKPAEGWEGLTKQP